jgi:hypothetical protein
LATVDEADIGAGKGIRGIKTGNPRGHNITA